MRKEDLLKYKSVNILCNKEKVVKKLRSFVWCNVLIEDVNYTLSPAMFKILILFLLWFIQVLKSEIKQSEGAKSAEWEWVQNFIA